MSDNTTLTVDGTTATSFAGIDWKASAAGFAATGLTKTTIAGGGDLNATGQSSFSAQFSVLDPVAFDFSAFYTATPTLPNIGGFVAVGLLRRGDLSTIFVDFPAFTSTFAHAGVLEAGDYEFTALASNLAWPARNLSPAEVEKGFAFDFTFSPVAATPEPASLMLLCTALFRLVARRRIKGCHE